MSEQPSNPNSQGLFRQVYEVTLVHDQPLELPVNAVFLSAATGPRQEIILFWEITYKVAITNDPAWEKRTIKAFATNRGIPSDALYLATVNSFGTPWHLYERRPAAPAQTVNKVEGPSKTKA